MIFGASAVQAAGARQLIFSTQKVKVQVSGLVRSIHATDFLLAVLDVSITWI
jgi:hypothetical protein